MRRGKQGRKHFRAAGRALMGFSLAAGFILTSVFSEAAWAGSVTPGWTLGGGEIRSHTIGTGESQTETQTDGSAQASADAQDLSGAGTPADAEDPSANAGTPAGAEDPSANAGTPADAQDLSGAGTPSVSETGSEAETSSAVSTLADPVSLPTGDLAIRDPSAPMELLSDADAEHLQEQMASYQSSGESLLINKAEKYYYYDQLDPTAKQIYDVIYQVCEDPVSEGNIGLVMTDMDPQGDEFYTQFNLAYRAICFDHPELFWLYAGNDADLVYASQAVIENGFYFVYLFMEEPYEDFRAAMTQFNQAAQAFLADIDTSGTEYDTIRQIHDKLIDLVNYDDQASENVFSGNGQDLAHTAYGCLVRDSEGIANQAVCDGYTLCFEYMLQQCGIETCFLSGMAGSDTQSMGGHAWSMVKADGTWFEVDATWDDRGSMIDDLTPGTEEYPYYMEALNNTAYREKIDHYLFLVSTEVMSDFDPGEDYTYITKDGLYILQLVGPGVHRRMTDFADLNPYDSQIIALAPTAVESFR